MLIIHFSSHFLHFNVMTYSYVQLYIVHGVRVNNTCTFLVYYNSLNIYKFIIQYCGILGPLLWFPSSYSLKAKCNIHMDTLNFCVHFLSFMTCHIWLSTCVLLIHVLTFQNYYMVLWHPWPLTMIPVWNDKG